MNCLLNLVKPKNKETNIMESRLFTELSASEQATVSGGFTIGGSGSFRGSTATTPQEGTYAQGLTSGNATTTSGFVLSTSTPGGQVVVANNPTSSFNSY